MKKRLRYGRRGSPGLEPLTGKVLGVYVEGMKKKKHWANVFAMFVVALLATAFSKRRMLHGGTFGA